MNLCIDCKHYLGIDAAQGTHMYGREKPLRWKAECGNPLNASVIDGSPWDTLETLRYGVGDGEAFCELDGWWEPK